MKLFNLVLLFSFVQGFTSFGQSTLPELPTPPNGRMLDVWRFQTDDWATIFGDVPVTATNLALTEDWAGYGLQMDSTDPALLTYSVIATAGFTNIAFGQGSMEMWFSPDWNTEDGIGNWGTLLEAGSWNTNLVAATGAWGLYFTPDGSNILFSAQSNGFTTNFLAYPITWYAGDWHHIAVTYSATNTSLFLEGVLVTNSTGIDDYSSFFTNTFSIGSDGNDTGLLQARGVFNNLITLNYELGADDISNSYAWGLNNVYPLPSGGFHGDGFGGVGPSPVGDGTNSGFHSIIFGTNDLWLGLSVAHNLANLLIHTPQTNSMYDVFGTTNMTKTAAGLNATNWAWLMRTTLNETNLLLTNLWATQGFFRLGTMLDTDGDGLPDAFEILVSKTNPYSRDSNTNGIMDGDELSSNGIPWRLEQVRLNSALVYATISNTVEGGACGQITVYLPSPAPSGGTTLQYQLGGLAIPNVDYAIPSLSSVFIPAGFSTATISVCAIATNVYVPYNRYMKLTLTNCTSAPFDTTPAQVNIIDTNLPNVRVFALPDWVRKPSSTFGTNSTGFFFIRDGNPSNTLTLTFTLSGTATNGLDYSTLPTSVTFAAGVRTNFLPVTIYQNNNSNSDSTIVLTLNAPAGYHLDSSNHVSTVTLAADGFPTLPSIQVIATVDDARQAGQKLGQFSFNRVGPTNSTLRVYYHVWGTAAPSYTNGAGSYVALPGYADILAGTTNAIVSVIPTNGNVTHIMETVVVDLTGGGDYSIGASNEATVYIDANDPISYQNLITRSGVYAASGAKQAEITVTRIGSALSSATMHINLAYGFSGNTLNSYTPGGDVSGSSVYWAVRQNIAHITIDTTWASYGTTQVNPTLTLSNSTAVATETLPFHPPSDEVTITSSTSPATVVTRGTTSTSALTFHRPFPTSTAFTVFYKVQTSGIFGTDFSINGGTSTSVLIPASENSVTVPVAAATATAATGWQTAVVTIDPQTSTQVGVSGQDTAYLRIQNPFNTTNDTDLDNDGISDGWELSNLANGYDPLVANNPYVDSDRDGMDLVEEIALGTNPNVPDAAPIYPSVDQDDYSYFTLRLGEGGKMANHSCAQCHEAIIKIGSLIRSCPRNGVRAHVSNDYMIRLLKGTNYPINVLGDPLALILPLNLISNTSPHYTATYDAELFDSTGVIYQLISDTNNLLGTSMNLTSETLTNTAMLYVPDLLIATDADRDGIVSFTNRVDRTSTNQPFIFWLNDDSDTGSDNNASDQNPASYSPDYNNGNATGLRDLEDFMRLQFKISGLPGAFLTNANLQTCVFLTNLTGSPAIKLFPSVETNGGIGYLTNTTTGTSQMGVTQLGYLAMASPVYFPNSKWLISGSNQFFFPMLFEGVDPGQCCITFGICSNYGPPLALSRPFYLNLQSVTNLFEHWTVGDDTVTDYPQIPINPVVRTWDSASFGSAQTTNDLDYILFVHGWRLQPWERRAFAATAYKRLWHQGYKGKFGMFSWPTDYVDLGSSHLNAVSFWETTLPNGIIANPGNFDRSERRAWSAGERLESLALLLNYWHSGRLNVIAHSMGNVVVGESLRRATSTGTGQIYRNYIAMQGAMASQVYDSNAPTRLLNSTTVNLDSGTFNLYRYFWNVPTLPASTLYNNPYLYDTKVAVGSLKNYFNTNDAALLGWEYDQDLKPDWDLPTYWHYDPMLGFMRVLTRLDAYNDRYEIFARISEARCNAMGAQPNLGGPFMNGTTNSQLDLTQAYNFQNADADHSGQFNSIIQNRYLFWNQLLVDFNLKNP